ncbi:MAG: cytochrome ubiquinol oxidase subunit I [Candidatus Nephthysia bennettiae]|nr:MAG: cytochrome ubiquinol oxidase subunit I [Candidatus Dormibacteraeota bacterium]
MDPTLPARVQFAFTISFHYIYPPITIGLGLILVVLGVLHLRTGNPVWNQALRFWVRIYALNFAVGIATGLVQEFQFGTNWSSYSRFVGDVFGSALAAEGIFAFFLESGFLGVMLFAGDRISARLQVLATFFVALGAHFSAIWIVVANSWMQTPVAYHLVKGPAGETRAEVTNFWGVVFNPSSMDRLLHVIVGAWMTGAFVVLSVSAWYLLRNRHHEFAHACMKVGLVILTFGAIFQVFISGDRSARYVAVYQPAKFAAMEGHWDSGPDPLDFIGWVDQNGSRTYAIGIPGGTSFLLDFRFDTAVKGLNQIRPDLRPSVNWVFQAYHVMISLGGFMLALSLTCCLFFFWGRRLFRTRWLLWVLVPGPIYAIAANLSGWWTAEIGRQPFMVYNVLRTSQGVSPNVPAGVVIASIGMFVFMYLLLGALYVFLLNDKVQHGPEEGREPSAEPEPGLTVALRRTLASEKGLAEA